MTTYYSVRAIKTVNHSGKDRVPGDVNTQDFVVDTATKDELVALGRVTVNRVAPAPKEGGAQALIAQFRDDSPVGIEDPLAPGLNLMPSLLEGGKFARKLRAAMREGVKWNPYTKSALALAATLGAATSESPFIEYGTAGGSAISSSTFYWYFANTTDVTPSGNGGALFSVNGLAQNGDTSFVNNQSRYLRVRGARTDAVNYPNCGGGGWTFSFITDAPIVKITTLGGTGPTQLHSLVIDGRHALPDGLNGGGGPNDIFVTFSTSKMRRYDMPLHSDQGVAKVEIGSAYALLPAPLPKLNILLLGDSYGLTTVGGILRDSLPHALRRITGANVIVQSLGASGYVAGTAMSNSFRIADALAVVDANTVIVPCLGLNDGVASTASITTAALSVFQQLRAGAPVSPILPLMYGAATDNSALMLGVEDAIGAAVSQFGDSLTRQILTIETPDPWLTGTRTHGDITGTYGNALAYIGGNGVDHTHPSAPIGTHYLAGRVANSMLEALVALNA